MPRRTRASSGGEYHAGLSPARKREVRGLRAGAAERVERHADERASDGEAEADPERDLCPDLQAAANCRGEVDEDRRDHERRHGPQQLDDREHSLQVGRRQREACHEQRRRDRRAEPDAGQARADEGRRLA